MVKHIVTWQFKEGTEEQVKDFLKGLQGLYGVIEVLRSVETGYNINPKEGISGALICTFDNMADLNSYATDPRHLAVASKCKPIRTSRTAVDYEF
ncbi:MAG: Dabb family protein [Succinivibrio sp.]|jgi:hypothetical protein|nr:Dabb family protein [Succinivibrio sp.]